MDTVKTTDTITKSNNPYAELLKSLRQNLPTFDDNLPTVGNEELVKQSREELDMFLMSVYLRFIKDEDAFLGMRRTPVPSEPSEITAERKRLEDKIRGKVEAEAMPQKIKFSEWAREKYANYYKIKDEAKAKNMAHFHYLKEMHEFLLKKAPAMADKVQKVLNTYYYGGA